MARWILFFTMKATPVSHWWDRPAWLSSHTISNLDLYSSLINSRASQHQCQPVEHIHDISNRSSSKAFDHDLKTTTPISAGACEEPPEQWGWGHAYLLRNTVNKGAAVCTVQLTARACQGTLRSFSTFIKKTRRHLARYTNDSVTYRKTIMCSISNEALALLKPLQRVFFSSSVFTSQHSCVSLSSSECARKTEPDGRLWGRLSRSNNVDCDR